MSLDQRLTRAAHQLAERVTTPEVDLAAVRAGARVRSRRRNFGVAAAALVLVAAVGTAVVSGRDPERTLPADPPESRTGASGAVWLDGNGLHHGTDVDTTPVDLTVRNRQVVLALVRSGALYTDSTRRDVWFHPWDGEPRIVGRDAKAGPGGDPQGDIAAWFELDVLVVYDTALGREVSRTTQRPVDHHVLEEHVRSGNGFVHLSDDEVVWAGVRGPGDSSAGRAVYRLDLETGVSARLRDSGRLEDVHDGVQPVSATGGTRLTVETPGQRPLDVDGVEAVGRFSPDGSWVLAPSLGGDDHGVVIFDATGATWDVLDEAFYGWLAWAYDDTAMVEVDIGEETYLLACDASERSCLRVGTKGRLVLANP